MTIDPFILALQVLIELGLPLTLFSIFLAVCAQVELQKPRYCLHEACQV